MSLLPCERIALTLDHKEADRVAMHESPWATTVTRWHTEGLPEDMTPKEYFKLELEFFGADLTIKHPHTILEDTDEYETGVNTNGAFYKQWKHMTSTPHYTDFTVKDRNTWEEHKPRLRDMSGRIDVENGLDFCRKKRVEGQFLVYEGGMGYDQIQSMVGSERLLMAMAEDPDWVRDMFEASGEIVINVFEEMLSFGFEFDAAYLSDDMGYRNASLFSPAMYKELLFPTHKRIFEFFHSKGLKVILHSCGCITELVPMLIEGGLDCLEPLEVKAGMDLLEMKKQYGEKLSFIGGLDARKISGDPQILEEEVRTKVTFVKQGGGYIFHSDHSIPDNVSFEQYKTFYELGLKYGRY